MNTFLEDIWKYHNAQSEILICTDVYSIKQVQKIAKVYKDIHLFNKCLLTAYYVPDKILSSRNTEENKPLLSWNIN